MLHSQLAREAGVPLASMPAEQLPTLPEPLHSHAHYMWLTSAVDVHISKLQADVSSTLLVAGIPNSMEWLTDDGLFSIDIAFQVCWVSLLIPCSVCVCQVAMQAQHVCYLVCVQLHCTFFSCEHATTMLCSLCAVVLTVIRAAAAAAAAAAG
jgi:hypothetical protein